MQYDSTPAKSSKYPYPPDGDILEGVRRTGSINALARDLDIQETALHRYIARRPELHRQIKKLKPPTQKHFNGSTGTKYSYPSNDELVALFQEHGYIAAVARHIDVSRGSLRHYIWNRPQLKARIDEVAVGGGAAALRKHRYPCDEQLIAMVRLHRTVARVSRELEIPQPNLQLYITCRPSLAKAIAGIRDADFFNKERQRVQHNAKIAVWTRANKARRAEGRRRRDAKAGAMNEETMYFFELLRSDPCSYCSKPGGTIDHVEPIDNGGDHHWTNMTAACSLCNPSKATRSLLEFLLIR